MSATLFSILRRPALQGRPRLQEAWLHQAEKVEARARLAETRARRETLPRAVSLLVALGIPEEMALESYEADIHLGIDACDVTLRSRGKIMGDGHGLETVAHVFSDALRHEEDIPELTMALAPIPPDVVRTEGTLTPVKGWRGGDR